MHGHVIRGDAPQAADIAAAIFLGIAVQHFLVESFLRDTDTVPFPHDGRKVADHGNKVVLFGAVPEIRNNALIGVIGIDPRKTAFIAVTFVKRGA
jgi:hypothetical protein